MILPLVLAGLLAKSIHPLPGPVPLRAEAPRLTLGGSPVRVEVVDNDSLRTLGLSGRTSLDWDRGMLFVFPEEAPRSFWMIDCHFDLDIAYLDSTGSIVDIQTMLIEPGVPPERLRNYPSASPRVMYALEMNRGWFKAKGVRVGERIPEAARFKTRR